MLCSMPSATINPAWRGRRNLKSAARLIDRDSLDLLFQMEAAKVEAADRKRCPEVELPTPDLIRKSRPGR
jgi:hypothetical protein